DQLVAGVGAFLRGIRRKQSMPVEPHCEIIVRIAARGSRPDPEIELEYGGANREMDVLINIGNFRRDRAWLCEVQAAEPRPDRPAARSGCPAPVRAIEDGAQRRPKVGGGLPPGGR